MDSGIRHKEKGILLCVMLSGALAALMYVLLLLRCKIVPFGEGTWVMFDLKRQYIDFYAYYKRIFGGGEGVFYSFQTALGSGLIGFFIYYLANPLFLLFLPFATDRLPLAVSFVIGVTLVLAAMIMAAFLWWYLGKRSAARGLPRAVTALIGAMAWSFSGFLIAHSMNMMWTDVVILVPVVLYMLETAFLEDGEAPDKGETASRALRLRRLGYTGIIALILLFNYYISYQVLLFVAMWTLVRLWEKRAQKPVRTILGLAAHTVAAVGVDAVVLLPTFLELANSPKDMLRIGAKATGRMLSPVDVFSKAYVLAYDGLQPRFGLPQIYCGILLGALALLFFLDHRRSLRERAASLIPLLVLLASFCLDPFNVFWHAMMEPSGHPYRQAPLFVLVCILCGCRYLADIVSGTGGGSKETNGSEGAKSSESSEGPDGSERSKRSGLRELLCRIARYAAGLLIAGAMLFFVGRGDYEYNSAEMLTENALRLAICFAGLFAAEMLSAGGRDRNRHLRKEQDPEDLSPRGRRSRLAPRQVFSLLLTVALIWMLAMELLGNAAFTHGFLSLQGDTRNGFLSEIDSVQPVVDAVKAQDDSFYRMENLTPRQQNDAMMYGYRGVTHYSSAGMVYVRYLLHKLGFNDDRLLTHYGHDNTVTMDMLLGIRYVLTRDGRLVHNSYERIESVPETGVMVYRNPYALPVALAVRDYDLEGITGIDDPYTIPMDPFALQEDMLSRLAGGRVQVFVPAGVEESGEAGAAELDVVITPEISGEVYMYLDGLMGTVQGLAVLVEEELLTGYGNASSYKILNLGYHEAGEPIHVRVQGDSEAPDFGRPIFVTEDMEAVETVFADLDRRGLEVRQHGSSGIDLQVPGDCGGIVTSIPYEEGWNVPGIPIYGALLYIPKESVERCTSDGVLKMRFVPKGMAAGGVISLLSLLLLAAWFFPGRRTSAGMRFKEKGPEKGPGTWLKGKTPGRRFPEKAGKVLLLAVSAVVIGLFCASDSWGREDRIYVRAGDRDIAVFQDDGGVYLFLPSGVSEEELSYSREAKKLAPQVLQSEGLPALFISTASGNLDKVYADREYRESGKIRVYDNTGALLYAGALEGIKGRGNYSWATEEWEKKSFSIRIDERERLLGQPAGGRFALLANASDDTLLRNDIGRALQVCMGMRYAERGTFTDLYINGEYLGVYYLCAAIDTGRDRIDISTRDPGGEGGFLLEREFKERYELELPLHHAGFVTSGEEHFVIHEPGYAAEDEIESVRAFMEQVETAILAGDDSLSGYVDMDTFVRTYLTEEVLKNHDGGVSSAYYYRDDRAGGRLFAAPGWDYDMSLGSYLEWMDDDPAQEVRMYPYEGASTWFRTLYEREDFRGEVEDLYRRCRENFARILKCREEDRPLGTANYRMEYLRWKGMYDARGAVPGSEEAFRLLTDFAAKRLRFLDTLWITG